MWVAIDNALKLVRDGGTLLICIYNDQGVKSHFWWIFKWFFNLLPRILRKPFAYTINFFVRIWVIIKYTVKLEPMIIIDQIVNYKPPRGMSVSSDIIDWYGGLPYEVANYEYLLQYIENKGFKLRYGKRSSSIGCHETVFTRLSDR